MQSITVQANQNQVNLPFLSYIVSTSPIIQYPISPVQVLQIESQNIPIEIQFFDSNLSFFDLLKLPDSQLKTTLLVINSSDFRRFKQAKEFAKKDDFLLLIIAYYSDYNSKSQQAVECLFELLEIEDNILKNYPQDNAFFDVETVICKQFSDFNKKLLQINKLNRQGAQNEINRSILYFIDIMINVDIKETLCVKNEILQILQQYTMNKKFIYDEKVQVQIQVIYQTLTNVINSLTLKKQLDLLLDLSQFSNTDFGFAYYYFQQLLCSISASQNLDYNIDQMNASKLIFQLNQKFLQNYHKIAGNVDSFQQQLNLTQALAMTYNHIDNPGEAKKFIQILQNSLLSENEFHNSTIQNLTSQHDVFEVIHFNQFLLHDVHLVLQILYEFISILSEQNRKLIQNDADVFVFCLIYNVNFRGYDFIEHKEQFQQGMNYTQIFTVANEITQFCILFSTENLHEILSYDCQKAIKLVKEYSMNELLLKQQVGIWKLIFNSNLKNTTYLQLYIQYAIQLLSNSIQWVKTQLYNEYFELLSIIMWFLIDDFEVQQSLTSEQLLQINQLVFNFNIKVLQFGVQTNQFIENYAYYSFKLDQLSEFQVYLVDNIKEFDPQYVCQFVFAYINNQSKLQNSDKSKYQNLVLIIITHYHSISYNQQNYVYLAQLAAGLIFFEISFSNFINLNNIFMQIEETFNGNMIPLIYYKQFLQQLIISQIWLKTNQISQIKQILSYILEKTQKLEIQKLINQIEHNLSQEVEITFESNLSTPHQSTIMTINQKIIFEDFLTLPNFPSYKEVEKLQHYTNLPGIPFAFVIPHALARETNIQTDLDSLIKDIGSVEMLQECVNDFLIEEQRPKSGKPVKQAFATGRPMSAGGVKLDVQDVQKVKVERKKTNVISQDLEWSGSGSDEENLLEMIDNEGMM